MKRFLKAIKSHVFDHPLDEIIDTLEQEGPKEALKKGVPFLVAGAVAVCLLVLVLALLYAVRRTIWKIAVLVVICGMLWASYRENRKSTGPAATKQPSTEQYITVGNITKSAVKKVAPILALAPVHAESDIKAAKDERIIQHGRYWLFKYRFLKKSISTDIDTDSAQRVLQRELQTILDNENPAGFDKIRFIYGGVSECILQLARVTQDDLYLYLYCCYASEDYFAQREREVEQHDTADTDDIEF